MKIRFYFIIVLNLVLILSQCDSAKILGLFTTFSKSHLIIHKAVMQPLIDRGHDVTIVTTLPLSDSNRNYRHILIDIPPPPKELVGGMIKSGSNPINMISSLLNAVDHFAQYNNKSLNDAKMKRLMAEESFDLVVFGYFFNTFQIGIAAHFKCPVVISFMQRPMGLLNDLVGNPPEILTVPQILAGGSQPLGFRDRLKNVLITGATDLGLFQYVEHRMADYYESNFPAEKYPSYSEMKTNVSLILSSYHFTNGVVRPHVPALVEIGGIQVKPKPDPLPQAFKKLHVTVSSINFSRSHCRITSNTFVFKMRFTVPIVISLLFSIFIVSDSAKILGLFATFSRSHLIVHKAAIQPLIDNGHDVTIVTTLPLDEPNKKYRHILLDVPPPPKEFMTGIIAGSGKGPLSLFGTMLASMDIFMQYSNQSLLDPKMQKLMAEESFDLLVFGYAFNTFQIGVAAHFKCPVVLSFMQRPLGFVNDMMGNPHETMIVPNIFVGNSQPMGFLDRVKNVVGGSLMDLLFLFLDRKMENIYEFNFPPEKYPSYAKIKKNVSLVLTNFHFSNGIVRPNVPAVVEVGGIQIKPKPDPLPLIGFNARDISLVPKALKFNIIDASNSSSSYLSKYQSLYKTLAELAIVM